VENFGNRPIVTTLGSIPSCEKSVPNLAETLQQLSHFSGSPEALHSFHILFTGCEKEDSAIPCKT
jgi:hypothetical protein